jgi:RNA polymerase sigma factor (sigma-70 family)
MGDPRIRRPGAEEKATKVREELSPSALRDSERGFEHLLRHRRFSPAFRRRHVADLLAQARLEYAKHVAAGETIANPTGWIIHCAWRRTQNLLERESNSPRPVALKGDKDFCEEAPTPEEEVVEADRRRRLKAAVEQLGAEERQILALTYFEGMSVREASRTLKWDKCKGDRRHRAALERLRELIDVDHIEDFEIEVGICAWASLEAGRHHVGTLGSLAELAARTIAGVAGRAHDLARRALTGGAADPGISAAAGTTARAAGACGAVAVACLASGVVGPGLGGVDLIEHRPPPKQLSGRGEDRAARDRLPATTLSAPLPSALKASEARPKAEKSARKTRPKSAAKAVARELPSESTSPSSASPAQVEEEFSPFAGGESQSTEPTPSSGGAPAPDSSGNEAPAAPQASGKQVEAEFGL